MALDIELYFFNLNGRHKFSFIYANSANMLVALFSDALICYIMQSNTVIDTVFGIKVRMSGLCINR